MYSLRFRDVWAEFDLLLSGMLVTLELTLITVTLGLIIGTVGAVASTSQYKWARRVTAVYVEIIRNTPLIIQVFLAFFGLSSLGFRLSPWEAAILALTINLGAYSVEIIRSGIEAVPRGQIEAGLALGLSRYRILRSVVLVPALQVMFPALASQFILAMLATSIVSQISVEELFFQANSIDNKTFRSFEVYIVMTGLYLLLTVALRTVFGVIESVIMRRGAAHRKAR